MRRFLSVALLLVFLGGCAKTMSDSELSSECTEATSYEFLQYQTLAPAETPSEFFFDEETAQEDYGVSVSENEVTSTSVNLPTTRKPETKTTKKAETTAAAKPATTTKGATTAKPATTTKVVTTAKPVTTTKAVTTSKPVTTTKPVTTAKPVTTTTKPSTTAKTTSSTPVVNEDYMAIIGMKSVVFGSSKQDVMNVLGQPTECITEQNSSGDTFESMVYASDYSELAVVQLKNGIFRGFYTILRNTIITDGESSYSLRSGGSQTFGKMKITVFDDNIQGGSYAIWAKYDGFSYVPETFSSTEGQEKLIFHLTNGVRVKNGLPALGYSDKATTSARIHSKDMADNNYFDHQSPDGRRAADRMSAQGISYRTCGENIASGYSSPFHFVNGWYNSPGHRSNILYSDFKYLGVGVASQGGSRHYATQNFYG